MKQISARFGVCRYIIADAWKHWLVLNINGVYEVCCDLEGGIARAHNRVILDSEGRA